MVRPSTAATTSRALTASAVTSGPMPSPPMTASVIELFIGSLSQTGRFDE
jgi:hypothetical protein